jgi:hypothetical protein
VLSKVFLKQNTMTTPSGVYPAGFKCDQLASASPDLLRPMLMVFVNTLMSAPARLACRSRRSRPSVTSGKPQHKPLPTGGQDAGRGGLAPADTTRPAAGPTSCWRRGGSSVPEHGTRAA